MDNLFARARRLPHPHPEGASRHRARGGCTHGHANTRILRRGEAQHPRLAVSPCGPRRHLRRLALDVCSGSPPAQRRPAPRGRRARLLALLHGGLRPPGKGLPVRNVEDTTFIDKQSHTDLPRWRGCIVGAWRLSRSRGASTPPRSTRPQLRSSQPQSPVPSLFPPPASSPSCPFWLSRASDGPHF